MHEHHKHTLALSTFMKHELHERAHPNTQLCCFLALWAACSLGPLMQHSGNLNDSIADVGLIWRSYVLHL